MADPAIILNEIKQNIKDTKSDLKEGIKEIKSDLKEDINEIKEDVKEIKKDIKETNKKFVPYPVFFWTIGVIVIGFVAKIFI